MISVLIELFKSGMALFQKKEEVQKNKDQLEAEAKESNQETNREEIKAGRGWRNYLGYVVTTILLYQYIIVPILDYFGIVLFSFPLSDIIRIIILLVSGS